MEIYLHHYKISIFPMSMFSGSVARNLQYTNIHNMKVSTEHVSYVQLLHLFSEYINSNDKDIKESQST